MNLSRIVLPLAVVTSALLLLTPYPLFDVDFGWHLRSGERIWMLGRFPRTDWFSFTLPNFPWIAHEWLHDLLLYQSYRFLGIDGIRVWFALWGLATAWIAFPLLCGATAQTAPLIGLLGTILLLVMHLWRAQIVTVCGFLLCWHLISRLQRGEDSRVLRWVPVLFLVWVNLHAGFAIGLGTLGAYVVLERLRRECRHNLPAASPVSQLVAAGGWIQDDRWAQVALVTALGALLTFVNPYGYRVYEEIGRTLTDSFAHDRIVEWQPPHPGELRGDLFGFTVLLSMIALACGRLRLDCTRFLLWCGLFWLAFHSQRHLPFFVFVTAAELLRSISGERTPKSWGNALTVGSQLFVGLVAAATIAYSSTAKRFAVDSRSRIERAYPLATAWLLRDHGQSCRLFHQINLGGFLLFGDPQRKVFIDGRMAHWMDGDRSLLEEAFLTIEARPGYEAVLHRHGVDAALIPSASALTRALSRDEAWDRITEEKTFSLFARRDTSCHTELTGHTNLTPQP